MADFLPQSEIPDISGSTVEESLGKVLNYLFMFNEQFRHMMYNLGAENWNSDELNSFTSEVNQEVAKGLGISSKTEIDGNRVTITITLTNDAKPLSATTIVISSFLTREALASPGEVIIDAGNITKGILGGPVEIGITKDIGLDHTVTFTAPAASEVNRLRMKGADTDGMISLDENSVMQLTASGAVKINHLPDSAVADGVAVVSPGSKLVLGMDNDQLVVYRYSMDDQLQETYRINPDDIS